MALPRVEVSIGITLNVGNYESVRAEARFGEDVEGTTSASWQGCIAEAKEGLKAALDGVEKMLAARKVKPAPGPPVPRSAPVTGPRRAGR
jgi:hypothetical protein